MRVRRIGQLVERLREIGVAIGGSGSSSNGVPAARRWEVLRATHVG